MVTIVWHLKLLRSCEFSLVPMEKRQKAENYWKVLTKVSGTWKSPSV